MPILAENIENGAKNCTLGTMGLYDLTLGWDYGGNFMGLIGAMLVFLYSAFET